MYPSPPPSIYQPQVSQQPSQLMPQIGNPNIHPPLPPTNSTPTQSYPQYNYNSNAASSGHPGQPSFVPQSMPYTMGGNAPTISNQQNNNLINPLSV